MAEYKDVWSIFIFLYVRKKNCANIKEKGKSLWRNFSKNIFVLTRSMYTCTCSIHTQHTYIYYMWMKKKREAKKNRSFRVVERKTMRRWLEKEMVNLILSFPESRIFVVIFVVVVRNRNDEKPIFKFQMNLCEFVFYVSV